MIDEQIPLRGMNLDSDLRLVKQGQTRYAKNVRFYSNDSGGSWTAESVIGNKQKFILPVQEAQNQQFLLYPIGGTSGVFDIFITGAGLSVNTAPTTYIDWATFIAALDAALTTAGLSHILSPVSTDFPDSYLLEITQFDYVDWTITLGNQNTWAYIVLQDAVNTQLAGSFVPIGGATIEENGKETLYVFGSTQHKLPYDLVSDGTQFTYSADGNGQYQLNFVQQVFQQDPTGTIVSVQVYGDTLGGGINGEWQASWTSATTLSLLGSVYNAATDLTVTIKFFTQGLGGLFKFNDTSVNPVMQLVSKKWNFRILKQIKCYSESNPFGIGLYWCDDYNSYRVFYDNGGEWLIQNGGNYSLFNLDVQTQLFSSNDSLVTFVEQLDTGGNILCGNWIYLCGFVTSSVNSDTNFSVPCNPINVTKSSNQVSSKILGFSPDVLSGKVNVLNISNIQTGCYSSVVLYGVHYAGTAIEAFRIKEEPLTSSQDSITLQHTGYENAIEIVDAGTLEYISQLYTTGKSIDAVENRLILSNLQGNPIKDFSDFAESLTYKLNVQTLSACGVTSAASEYQDPSNVNRYMGLMINEKYRFGMRIKLLSNHSYLPVVYHIADIVVKPSNNNGGSFANNNLTDALNVDRISEVYVPYVEFTIPKASWDTLIDGVPARNLIEEIEIVRCENTNPTILGMGVGCGIVHLSTIAPTGVNYLIPGNTTPNTNYLQFNNLSQDSGKLPVLYNWGTNTSPYDYLWSGTGTRGLALYFADDFYQGNKRSFLTGDQIINLGIADSTASTIQSDSPGTNFGSSYTYLTGYTNTVDSGGLNQQTIDISATTWCDGSVPQSAVDYNGELYYNALNYVNNGGTQFGDKYFYNFNCSVVLTDSDIDFDPTVSGRDNWGMVLCQYSRPNSDQYGDIATSKYISTGAYAKNSNTNVDVIIPVFGGDVFTQRVYLKRLQKLSDDGIIWWESIICYYAQNRVNAQMRTKAYDTQEFYPQVVTLEEATRNYQHEEFEYNKGYTVYERQQLNTLYNYNSLLPIINDFPVRAIWSNNKPDGSGVDDYRTFPPLNFKDYEMRYGEIMHHANVNRDLYVWQLHRFVQQYFTADALLQTKEGAEVIVGEGAPASRAPQDLSYYGTQHGFSVGVFGASKGGKQMAAWIDLKNKVLLRYGRDGSVPISEVHDISSWLKNNVPDYIPDTPAAGEGICVTWNQEFREWIWTICGSNYDYTNDGLFVPQSAINDVVLFYGDNDKSFERRGTIYKCTDNNGKGYCEITDITDWTFEERVEPLKTIKGGGTLTSDYYTEYSIYFDETKNAFGGFYSFLPRIYFTWKNGIITPHPGEGFFNSFDVEMYIHNEGDIMTWYPSDVFPTPYLQTNGWIELVYNKQSADTKQFAALQAQSYPLQPYGYEFATQNHESYLVRADFVDSDWDMWRSTIKLDSSNTGINDGDSDFLWGTWLVHRFIFAPLEKQKLSNVVVKALLKTRLINS